jgi:hypothetical protein
VASLTFSCVIATVFLTGFSGLVYEVTWQLRIWEERGHRLGRKPDRIWEA